MSVFTELKTPVTGAYQQPTGLYVIHNPHPEGTGARD